MATLKPPLIGPSYNLRNTRASLQRTINLVPVPLEPGNERTAWVFRDVPGLVAVYDPVFVLQSLIYPLEFSEGFNTSSDLQQGDLSEAAGSFNVSTALVAGALDVVIAYQTLKADPDGFDVATALAAGDLITVIAYQQIKSDPDGFDVATDFVSGDLTTVISYVTHRDPADDEGFDVSTALVGGTLS